MALESACTRDGAVLEEINLFKALHSYVEDSAKGHHLFQSLQDETTTPKKLCETRLHHKYSARKNECRRKLKIAIASILFKN